MGQLQFIANSQYNAFSLWYIAESHTGTGDIRVCVAFVYVQYV
ncbi:hypothetical protein [Dyadobacter crusticola]|nr:hypothetical protein [Dyadobacter crusticola]